MSYRNQYPVFRYDPSYTMRYVSGPTGEAVTVDALKSLLGIDGNDQDEQLTGLIRLAQQQFSEWTGRVILPTVYRQSQKEWTQSIPLRMGKATSVSSVSYFDADDQEQPLTGWFADLDGVGGTIDLPDDLPALSSTVPYPIRVEFITGWPTPDLIPPGIRNSLLVLAAYWWQNPEKGTPPELTIPGNVWTVWSNYQTGLRGKS